MLQLMMLLTITKSQLLLAILGLIPSPYLGLLRLNVVGSTATKRPSAISVELKIPLITPSV